MRPRGIFTREEYVYASRSRHVGRGGPASSTRLHILLRPACAWKFFLGGLRASVRQGRPRRPLGDLVDLYRRYISSITPTNRSQP